jgi:hypothetical protein
MVTLRESASVSESITTGGDPPSVLGTRRGSRASSEADLVDRPARPMGRSAVIMGQARVGRGWKENSMVWDSFIVMGGLATTARGMTHFPRSRDQRHEADGRHLTWSERCFG